MDADDRGELSSRKRARRAIPSAGEPTRPLSPARGRRLTEAERRALQERRQARVSPPPPTADPRPPSRPAPQMPRPQEPPIVASRGLVALGAVLVAGLAVVAFGGARLFGPAGGDPPPDQELAGISQPAVPVASTPRTSVPVPTASTPIAVVTSEAARAPVVCLDPGHGGPDRGVVREESDVAPALEEAVLVLQYAWDLEARLKQRGYDVVLTRRTDVAVNADGLDVNGVGKSIEDDPHWPAAKTNWTLDEMQTR